MSDPLIIRRRAMSSGRKTRYLKFTAQEDNCTVRIDSENSPTYRPTEYSMNGGPFTLYNYGDTIYLDEGDTVEWRRKYGEGTNGFSTNYNIKKYRFKTQGHISVNGYITTLLRSDGMVSSINAAAFPSIADGQNGLSFHLEIPDIVKSLGIYSFYGNSCFTGELVLPSSLDNIPDYTFYSCSGFTGTLTIPDSVTAIGQHAFQGCSNLDKLDLGNGVVSIGAYAFQQCSRLIGAGPNGELVIPSSVTTISGSAFYRCTGFSGMLVIPDSVTTIGNYAFYNCNGFTGTLTIPDSVTSLEHSTFSQCSGLTAVVIPESISVLNGNVFNGCIGIIGTPDDPEDPSSIGPLVIPDSIVTIGESSFYNCTHIKGILLGQNLVSIGNRAFWNCNQMIGNGENGELVIPDSVISIGAESFYSCNSLTGLVLGNSLLTINNYAFRYCNGIDSFTIPSSVTTIGHNPFRQCAGLTSVMVDSGNQYYTSRDSNDNECNAIIEISTGKLVTGCMNTPIAPLPDNVSSIGSYAFTGIFSGAYNPINFAIPSTVTSIGSHAFESCWNIYGVTIPDSVTYIGEYAFSSTHLSSVVIPRSVVTMGSPSSTEGRNPFTYCNYMASMTVDGANPYFDSRNNCNAIIETSTNTLISGCKGTVIPDTVTSIGSYSFYGIDPGSGFSSINIPSSVTSIGEHAFQSCSFTSITIPNSVNSINASCIRGCISLTQVNLPDSQSLFNRIPNYCFYGCTRLPSITIPESVDTIEICAFQNCNSLSTMTVLASTPPALAETTFGNTIPSQTIIYVPYSADHSILNAYKTATNWSRHASKIRELDENGNIPVDP